MASTMLNEIIGRVRINESKIATLRERLLITDNNMVKEYKNLTKEIKNINSEIREIKKEIFNIKETLQNIIKEMNQFARKSDLKVLEKYINLWDPLKFVTEKEVKKLIKEELKTKNAK